MSWFALSYDHCRRRFGYITTGHILLTCHLFQCSFARIEDKDSYSRDGMYISILIVDYWFLHSLVPRLHPIVRRYILAVRCFSEVENYSLSSNQHFIHTTPSPEAALSGVPTEILAQESGHLWECCSLVWHTFALHPFTSYSPWVRRWTSPFAWSGQRLTLLQYWESPWQVPEIASTNAFGARSSQVLSSEAFAMKHRFPCVV